MAKVLLLTCLLALAHQIAGQCNTNQVYTQTLIPACAQNDVYIFWPNYENFATYYTCQGMGNPVLSNCPVGEYFCFVLQECTTCANWLPPVHCSQLRTQNTPNCVPMGQGGNVTASPPVTNAPTSAPATNATEASTVSTVTATPLPPTVTPPMPPTVNPNTPSESTDVPPPPSPVTNAPNIPMPPTPGPTPPSVNVDPPNVGPVAPIV